MILNLEIFFFREWRNLPCYNGGFSDSRAAENKETVAVFGQRLARVLLGGSWCRARTNRNRENCILRAWRSLEILSTPSTPYLPGFALLDRCWSISTESLHATKQSATRLQLKEKFDTLLLYFSFYKYHVFIYIYGVIVLIVASGLH